eukprot:TRINITY_DN6126_c0_g2_i11.p1 TRINITY_DN6126_c0_g2~~TRINITY_DN6126_c0_g2_i11.p1  ORF type:complete len:150 (+),score=22.20 TRINITY_DN6126_c0_g2_i11:194-643(+)
MTTESHTFSKTATEKRVRTLELLEGKTPGRSSGCQMIHAQTLTTNRSLPKTRKTCAIIKISPSTKYNLLRIFSFMSSIIVSVSSEFIYYFRSGTTSGCRKQEIIRKLSSFSTFFLFHHYRTTGQTLSQLSRRPSSSRADQHRSSRDAHH